MKRRPLATSPVSDKSEHLGIRVQAPSQALELSTVQLLLLFLAVPLVPGRGAERFSLLHEGLCTAFPYSHKRAQHFRGNPWVQIVNINLVTDKHIHELNSGLTRVDASAWHLILAVWNTNCIILKWEVANNRQAEKITGHNKKVIIE